MVFVKKNYLYTSLNDTIAPLSTSAFACLSSNFCPLRTVYEINSILLTSLLQACAYPRSPDMNAFEDILLNNMFLLDCTDHCLIGEGELWIGGLASIAFVLIIAMAYAFAMSYLNQYPSEKVGPSTFAYNTTIRNTKFQSNLQTLAVPVFDEEQPMFNLLNEQNFTFHLKFINTVASCMILSISEVTNSTTISMALSSCSDINGTLLAVLCFITI
ncbi:unnamed protein product [Rotaria sp. Silwood1]|nr:unnamed protein product [Rotaria sp. Silwood1]CAF4594388.1 unnamed protein product [Rotaria sp. Silwood1]